MSRSGIPSSFWTGLGHRRRRWRRGAGTRCLSATGGQRRGGRVGKNAERWRELCTDLLAPDPGSRPKLADVSWLVQELAPRRRLRLSIHVPRQVRLIPVATACLLAVALGIVATMTILARRE